MARVLLTGATGFVGSAVLRRLLLEGHEVVALHASRQPGHEQAEWRKFDILTASADEVARLVENAAVSHCVHAAWYTNHSDYLIAAVNREWMSATLRLAEGFRSGGGERFIGLGTCLEYDQEADGGRFSEARTPLRPETLYARCKTETFERLVAAASSDRCDFAWARLFFVYGPGDRDGRLIPYILGSLRKGVRVGPRYGGLRRDYIHVDDLAGQLSRIMIADFQGPVNCGTGEAEPIDRIFRIAGNLMDRLDLVDSNDNVTSDESVRIEADMELFRARIGDPATRSLQQGIGELIGDLG
jgi:nucleoside-diphosphate-sugar epimerase